MHAPRGKCPLKPPTVPNDLVDYYSQEIELREWVITSRGGHRGEIFVSSSQGCASLTSTPLAG